MLVEFTSNLSHSTCGKWCSKNNLFKPFQVILVTFCDCLIVLHRFSVSPLKVKFVN